MKTILILLAVLALIIYLIYKGVPAFYRVKSRSFFADGDYKSAQLMLEKAMRVGNLNDEIGMEYSYILLRTGEFEKTEQTVNNILSKKVTPQLHGRAVIQRCLCYYKNGNFDEAYNDALELYNDGYRSINLYALLGYFKLLNSPNSEETFDFCAEAYEYADDDRDICDNMVLCYYNKGEYDKAKELSDIVLESNPKFIEAWYHAAQIDIAMNNYNSAREKLEKIDDCNRSFMTTVSQSEIDKLKKEIDKLSEVKY